MKNNVNRASLGAKKNLNLFNWLFECSTNAVKIGQVPYLLRQKDDNESITAAAIAESSPY